MELYNLLEFVKIMGLHNHVWIELVEEKYNAMIKERNDLADEVAQLTSHILSDGAFQEWQSIETAPKDGGYILCWSEGTHRILKYRSFPASSCCPAEAGWFDDVLERWLPTHWMPLPEPPKEQS